MHHSYIHFICIAYHWFRFVCMNGDYLKIGTHIYSFDISINNVISAVLLLFSHFLLYRVMKFATSGITQERVKILGILMGV